MISRHSLSTVAVWLAAGTLCAASAVARPDGPQKGPPKPPQGQSERRSAGSSGGGSGGGGGGHDAPAPGQGPGDEMGGPRVNGGPGQGPGGAGEGFLDREQSPEQMRAFVSRQVERLKHQQELMQKALDMVNNNEPPEKIRAAVREALLPQGAGRFGDRLRQNQGRPDWPGVFGGPEGGRPGGPGGPDGPGGPGGRPGLGGPEGPGGPEGGPDARPREIKEEMVDSVMDFVKKNRPGMFERLSQLRRDDPQEFRRFLRDKGQQVLQMMKDQRDNPRLWEARQKLFDAEQHARKAAHLARGADEQHKEEATAKLRESLAALFDARVAVGKLDLEEARKRVELLEKRMSGQIENRDAFLKERFEKAMAGEELRDPMPPPPGNDGPGGPRGGERGKRPPER